MQPTLEILFTPADFAALANRDLSQSACVVFDVLRATTTIVSALAHGAASVIPVAEISDAVELRRRRPEVLLAGEREGLRIRAAQSGWIDFDLGNSPREFITPQIRGKTIVLTTTNGSRALRACAHAQTVLAGSFLNLIATADYLARHPASHIMLVCSGTGEQTALEDVLGAGALAELLWPQCAAGGIADSAKIALQIYQLNSRNLPEALAHSKNGARLLSIPELRDDVAWCLQRDVFPLAATLEQDRIVKAD